MSALESGIKMLVDSIMTPGATPSLISAFAVIMAVLGCVLVYLAVSTSWSLDSIILLALWAGLAGSMAW